MSKAVFLSGGSGLSDMKELYRTFSKHIKPTDKILIIKILDREHEKPIDARMRELLVFFTYKNYTQENFFKALYLKNKFLFQKIIAVIGPDYAQRMRIRGDYERFGVTNLTFITDSRELDTVKLSEFKAVKIDAGNTVDILKALHRDNFIKKLKEFYRNGGIVHGKCAGAVVLGYDITADYSISKTEVAGLNTHGLNIVKNISVWTEYAHVHDEAIRSHIQKNLVSVLAIPKHLGVSISDGMVHVLGKGKVFNFVYNRGKRTIEKIPISRFSPVRLCAYSFFATSMIYKYAPLLQNYLEC